MTMDVWVNVVISLMYGSHDMRHTSFLRVDGLSLDPRDLRRHSSLQHAMQWSCYILAIHLNKTMQPAHLLQNVDFQQGFSHLLPSTSTHLES